MLLAADRTSAAGTSWRTSDQDPDDEDDDGGDDGWRNSRRTPDSRRRTRHRLQPLRHRSRVMSGKSDHFLGTFSPDSSPRLPLEFLCGETEVGTRTDKKQVPSLSRADAQITREKTIIVIITIFFILGPPAQSHRRENYYYYFKYPQKVKIPGVKN